MSSTLMWRPAITDAKALPSELKRVISRKLWDTDGTCGGGEVLVDIGLIPYLEGLRDSGVKGAVELIRLIEHHGAVLLWHEH